MSKKIGVKKGSAEAMNYQKRKETERVLTGVQQTQYTEQRMLDIVVITLGESFGFGETRIKRFKDEFLKIEAEIKALEKEDAETDTSGHGSIDRKLNGAYAKKNMEERLKRICGAAYQPRSVRYSYSIRRNGEVIMQIQEDD